MMERRPCWVEISTAAFEDNYRLLADAFGGGSAPIELLAVVKADAYGHGLALCAPAAVRAGARWLGVTSVEEGVAAREATRTLAPETEIVVIGGVFPGQGAAVLEHRLIPVVWEPSQFDELEAAASAAGCGPGTVGVHLEFDTGMRRQGVDSAQLEPVLTRFAENGAGSPLRIDGLMTHLYAADERDGEATREQFARLEALVERMFAAGVRPERLHVGNSAALLLGEGPESALGMLRGLCERYGMRPMVRPGLALYGLAPEYEPPFGTEGPPVLQRMRRELSPVLAWKTRVVSVRDAVPGDVVGYNGTFVATEPMRLALLAVGYADGLKRALSNRGSVLIRGCRAPIVGRISMDQTVVDVTEIPEVTTGDEVVLLGRQGDEEIAAGEHAAWAGTISWEIFTSIAARVERRQESGTRDQIEKAIDSESGSGGESS